jgi:type II secretory pathway component HofQ
MWIGFDWIPDQDHGANILTTLQFMLLQADGRTIQLLPAWPANWDVSFKLHAPYNTTVEGVFKAGKMEQLKVTPASRTKDVVRMDQDSKPTQP